MGGMNLVQNSSHDVHFAPHSFALGFATRSTPTTDTPTTARTAVQKRPILPVTASPWGGLDRSARQRRRWPSSAQVLVHARVASIMISPLP